MAFERVNLPARTGDRSFPGENKFLYFLLEATLLNAVLLCVFSLGTVVAFKELEFPFNVIIMHKYSDT